MIDEERPDSRRSWIVAWIAAVAMVFTFGTPMSYGIFRAPFAEAFGFSPVALSGVFALMLFTFFVGSGVVGVFGARLPARGVLLACAVVTGLLAPVPYVIDSVVGLALAFAALGLALGTVFVVVASVVPRWFDERRGAATGLLFVGNGVGLTVLPPVWQRAFATVGVQRGFLAILSVTAGAFLLAGLVCRRPRWAEPSGATTGELFEWLARLGDTATFQYLFLGVGLSFAWYQLLASFAVDLFAYRGLTEAGASIAFGLIGGISVVSRLGSGYLADRAGTRRTYVGSLVAVAIGAAALFVPARSALDVAIALTGLGLGGAATLYIPLLMDVYSPEMDSAIVGVFNVAAGVAALLTPPLGTATIAYTGSYTAAVALTFLLTVIGIWAILAGTRGEAGATDRAVAGND